MHELAVTVMAVVAVFALPMGSERAAAGQLMAGEVQPSLGATKFGGSCYVGRGFSTFQMNTGRAVISFDEIVDSAIWDLRGQAVMTFSSSAGGDIRFKQTPAAPTAIKDPPFTNFTQAFDPIAQRLVVTFSIAFPDCTLPIVAVYDVAM